MWSSVCTHKSYTHHPTKQTNHFRDPHLHGHYFPLLSAAVGYSAFSILSSSTSFPGDFVECWIIAKLKSGIDDSSSCGTFWIFRWNNHTKGLDTLMFCPRHTMIDHFIFYWPFYLLTFALLVGLFFGGKPLFFCMKLHQKMTNKGNVESWLIKRFNITPLCLTLCHLTSWSGARQVLDALAPCT